MFKSFSSKITSLIACMMGITAAAILFCTHRDVGQAMLSSELASAQNVLQLMELNIRTGYNRLVYDKIEILSRLDNELKHLASVSASVINEFVRLQSGGNLAELEILSKLRKNTSPTYSTAATTCFLSSTTTHKGFAKHLPVIHVRAAFVIGNPLFLAVVLDGRGTEPCLVLSQGHGT